MKLFYSTPSPFARKARIVIRELGLLSAVEEIECNPFADTPALLNANPLGLVPTLALDDGTTMFDSPVICDYINAAANASGKTLIPDHGSERWRILRAQALADGALEVAISVTAEQRRPAHERSRAAIARSSAKLVRAVDAIAADMPLSGDVTLGHIAYACVFGYLDFRHPTLVAWRAGHPALADWYAQFISRPSFADTRPSDSTYQRFPARVA